MVTLSQPRTGLSALTLVVWALAAGSMAYWGLRLVPGVNVAAPMLVPAAGFAAIDLQSVARVLGATAPQAMPQVSLASRFALQGVVAGSPGGGAALIAVDGLPARAFRVGSAVDEGLILQSAAARQATLAASRDGPALVRLEMPALNN